MAKILQIAVLNKIAEFKSDDVIICGNGDYQIEFDFDAEWTAHNQKTARFEWGGKHHDVEFTGNICNVPVIMNAKKVTIGVFVGEIPEGDPIISTTRCTVPCVRSIRDGNTTADDGTGANYTNEARGYAAEAREAMANIEQYKGLEFIGEFECSRWYQEDHINFTPAEFYSIDKAKFMEICVDNPISDFRANVMVPLAVFPDKQPDNSLPSTTFTQPEDYLFYKPDLMKYELQTKYFDDICWRENSAYTKLKFYK